MDDKENKPREAPEEDIVDAEGSESGEGEKSSEDGSGDQPDTSEGEA